MAAISVGVVGRPDKDAEEGGEAVAAPEDEVLAKVRIWPWLSYVCQIRSTSGEEWCEGSRCYI